MHNDVTKKVNASAMMLTLVAVMFFPIMNSYIGNPVTRSPLDNLHWWNTEWPYRKLITIDHTKVSADLMNFPVLISRSTDSELAEAAQPAGQDIVFVRYADNSTILNHEIEFFNHTNGQLVAWINLTSVSATSDTKLWMYYGNTICGSQENVAATWDSNYIMIQHLNETGNTVYDSTSYNSDGILTGTDFISTGKIDGGRQYDDNDRIVVNNFTHSPNALTAETWVYRDNTSFIYLFCKGTYSTSSDWILYLRNNQPANQGIDFSINNHGSYIRTGDTPVNHWFYLTATYNCGNAALYYNGTQIASVTGWPAIFNNYLHLGLGNDYLGTNGGENPMTQVKLDELRISKIARNSSWITTCYNNQNNPSTFYVIEAEEQYLYTLTISLDGGGNVTKDPDQLTYPYGIIVTLTANPDLGWSFDHWSGDISGSSPVTTVTMEGNKSVTAHFSQNVYTVSISVDPVAGGFVFAVPTPPYYYGTVVTLTATANPGYTFDHWSGDLTGNLNPATLLIDGNKTVIASFIFENALPVAVNDSATVLENSLNNSLDVLANDYDPDGDNLTITSVTQPLNGVSYQDGSYVYYTPLASYTGSDSFTYNISDGVGGTASAVVFIAVVPMNTPPYAPSHPVPENGETNVSITTDLGWIGGDPDPDDIVRYDVYFGTTSSPSLVSSNQSTSTYDLGILAYDTTYYWRIVSWDTHNASAEGALWHFTTQQEEGIVVNITRPLDNSFYLRNIRLFSLPRTTVVYGPITIKAKVTADAGVDRVKFYIDGKLKKTDSSAPYTYHWAPLRSFKHVIMVRAYDTNGHTASDELTVFKWRLHPLVLMGGALLLTNSG